MKVGNIEQFKHLSQFRDLKDFNNNIEQWMIDLKSKFTKSELIALKRLIRYSSKVAGVCNAKIATIVSATHELDGIGISRSTFKRMVTKAKAFGLLTVYETERKNGSQSSNLYVFNRYPVKEDVSISQTIELPKEKKLNCPQTNNLSKTSNQNNINKRNENVSDKKYLGDKLDGSFTSSRVPAEFRDLVKCFYDDYKTIEELWKVIQIQTYYLTYYSLDDRISLAIDSFKQLIRNIKQGRKVRNIFGYYWGIVQKKLDAEYKSILFEVA
ncbi:hypothetical protein PNH38_02550 [Anoxybacillus rupiensis]|uniref:Helix-turn-helix domain-containing protein n=1 Tax=Anoxybacteroides rupiense TaxID=311460 RepID=A0ABT5W0C4_9BACL|nr:hypothetical protein [Anoxybacillus rupiensis]MDE8562761.1 hypothetical protein [Anoxybacillus rupiensis]